MTWSLRGYIRKLTSTNQMHCGPMYANNLLSAKIEPINILTSLSELYSSTGIIISCWKTQSSQSFSFQAAKLGALNMNQNFPARSKLLTYWEFWGSHGFQGGQPSQIEYERGSIENWLKKTGRNTTAAPPPSPPAARRMTKLSNSITSGLSIQVPGKHP